VIEILHRRYFERKPQRLADLEEARANYNVALKIRQLRDRAGMTQTALAKLARTPSVICRLEDADYDGHSLTCCGGSLRRYIDESRFDSCQRDASWRELTQTYLAGQPLPSQGTYHAKSRVKRTAAGRVEHTPGPQQVRSVALVQ
jgi:hypothetical protein